MLQQAPTATTPTDMAIECWFTMRQYHRTLNTAFVFIQCQSGPEKKNTQGMRVKRMKMVWLP